MQPLFLSLICLLMKNVFLYKKKSWKRFSTDLLCFFSCSSPWWCIREHKLGQVWEYSLVDYCLILELIGPLRVKTFHPSPPVSYSLPLHDVTSVLMCSTNLHFISSWPSRGVRQGQKDKLSHSCSFWVPPSHPEVPETGDTGACLPLTHFQWSAVY